MDPLGELLSSVQAMTDALKATAERQELRLRETDQRQAVLLATVSELVRLSGRTDVLETRVRARLIRLTMPPGTLPTHTAEPLPRGCMHALAVLFPRED
jgi:hypothetical protein